MHQMQGIGNGIEHNPRAAEHAGPLADCPGKAVFIADDVEGLFAFDMNLIFPFFQQCSAHNFSSVKNETGVLQVLAAKIVPENA